MVEHLPMAIPSPGILLLKRLTLPRLAAHVAVGGRAARQVEQLTGLLAGLDPGHSEWCADPE